MNVVHVYAKNLQVFADAVEGTECRLNASQDLDYLLRSLQNFNARDVLGLIVFANPMTKKCIRLMRKFDSLFVYDAKPVVVISDAASELHQQGYFKLENSKLYLVNSEENSISDVELSAIFTTLLATAGEVYDLSGCSCERKKAVDAKSSIEEDLVLSDSLQELLATLEGSV